MAIHHFDVATEGLRKTHQWIATLGFWQVEISVEKPKYGYKPDQIQWEEWNRPLDETYIVKITVTYKNRVWKIERLISEPMFDRLKVTAKFLRLEKIAVGVSATYKKIINTIKVLATRKG